jgi:hypothetical protein
VRKPFLLIKIIGIFILFFQTIAFSQTKNPPKKDSVKLSTPAKGKSVTKKGKTELSLFGSMNLSNQQIDDKNINGSFNYIYDEVNSNTYKSGYSGGFRIDRITKKNRQVGLVLAINRVIAGNYYINKHTVAPFIDDFTHYKADNQFTTVSLGTHLKPLLAKGNKHKLYLVVGPSFDYRISNFSSNSLVNNVGRSAFVNGDIGAEFDNNGYYVLFTHYKYGQEILNTNIPVRLSRIEVGISIKAKDLF